MASGELPRRPALHSSTRPGKRNLTRQADINQKSTSPCRRYVDTFQCLFALKVSNKKHVHLRQSVKKEEESLLYPRRPRSGSIVRCPPSATWRVISAVPQYCPCPQGAPARSVLRSLVYHLLLAYRDQVVERVFGDTRSVRSKEQPMQH